MDGMDEFNGMVTLLIPLFSILMVLLLIAGKFEMEAVEARGLPSKVGDTLYSYIV